MIDYQRIADDMRSFIEGEDHSRDPQLDELAQSYAEACKEVNNRLRRCGDLLRRGLRSEAIHLSQEHPDLLDTVAALDVPMLEVWENACATYGLPKARRLSMDIASELNDAYAAEEPLKASLDELRLLALARAPAAQRLAVVWRLRKLDPITPYWAEDAAKLERVCLSQMRLDLPRMAQAGDVASAKRIGDQLCTTEWVETPPRDLIDSAAHIEVKGWARELVLAREANDGLRVRRGLDAINKVIARRKFTPRAEEMTIIRREEAWLQHQNDLADERENFNELCAQLEAATHHRIPLQQLESLYARIQAYHMPIPPGIREEYETAVRDKRLLRDRARRRNLVGGVAILLLTVAGIYLGLHVSRNNQAAQKWINQINQDVSQFDFELAQRNWEMFEKQSPSLANRADIVDVKRRMDFARAEEERRVEQLANALEVAISPTASVSTKTEKFALAERFARLDTERLNIRMLRRQHLTGTSAPATTAPAHTVGGQ